LQKEASSAAGLLTLQPDELKRLLQVEQATTARLVKEVDEAVTNVGARCIIAPCNSVACLFFTTHPVNLQGMHVTSRLVCHGRGQV
jgi:hypothetical protein